MAESSIFRASLSINQEKIRVDHPDIVGSITLEPESYSIGLWHQTTKDGAREYYSGVMQLIGDRSQRFKIKLYEMRKAVPNDPEYHTPSSTQIGPHSLYGYLWIRPSKNGEIAIGIELRETPRLQKLTDQAEEFRAHLRSKFDDVARNELGEPLDINF